ncbi:MAG: hypothetical protein QGG40_17905, partial [Myxococcota bacterium]|nr:hypothetical protein [Myxococcota bacterium]
MFEPAAGVPATEEAPGTAAVGPLSDEEVRRRLDSAAHLLPDDADFTAPDLATDEVLVDDPKPAPDAGTA